jgi:16S rRNA (adenine1518-N6/adenine1519-N6)-dimethyltransferase
MVEPKKSLGQHWLHDHASLKAVAAAAELTEQDTVLEIGPGMGTLTSILVRKVRSVVAVELDHDLASKLSKRVPADNLKVVEGDILTFDLGSSPAGYKVVANIPYYLTGKILRFLIESANPPSLIVLLIQKEVAERIVAKPGNMSILAVSTQLDYIPTLGQIVPAELFSPPPKVDSQIIQLIQREHPLFVDLDRRAYLGIVKAGFSQRRKKLRSALSGGLHRSVEEIDDWLEKVGVDGNSRAQQLSLDDWYKIYQRRYSAGGVIIGPYGHVVVVNQDGRTWSLPKGGVNPGEDELAAAKREIYEETGLTKIKLIKKLGSYERFAMGLKGEDLPDRQRHISMYLFSTKEQELMPQDPANPEARWMDVDEVENLLSHAKDKEFFRSIKNELPLPRSSNT